MSTADPWPDSGSLIDGWPPVPRCGTTPNADRLAAEMIAAAGRVTEARRTAGLEGVVAAEKSALEAVELAQRRALAELADAPVEVRRYIYTACAAVEAHARGKRR